MPALAEAFIRLLPRHHRQPVGQSFDKIVKCTVMLADIAGWPTFNAVYRTYFKPPSPARSTFATTGFALGARVEVECVARR